MPNRAQTLEWLGSQWLGSFVSGNTLVENIESLKDAFVKLFE